MNVPDGWQTKALGDILRYEQPYRYSVSSTDYDDKSGIPVLTAGKSFILGYTTETEGIYNNLPVIIFDDFTTDSKYVDFPFKVKSSAMKFLMPKDVAVTDLKLVFGHIQRLKIRETGGDHKRRWISDFSKIKIHLPLPAEQRQIARILSKVDEAISQTEQLIAKYRRLKTGLMQDLLTKGIDEHGNIRSEETHAFKDSPLGRIPVEWEVNKLQIICAYDITYGIVQAGPDFANGVPYIRTGDMSGDKLSIDGLLRTNPIIAARFSRSRVQAGEIVFALRASIGKVLIVPQELDGANLTQGTARISAKENIVTNNLLLWCLRMPSFKNQILQNQKGTTFFEISLTQLRKMQVSFPKNLEEQKTITTILETAERNIESSELRLLKLKSQKTGLMQDLLSGKVRGGQLIHEIADV